MCRKIVDLTSLCRVFARCPGNISSLFFRVILLFYQRFGISIVSTAEVCAIHERTSGFDPSSSVLYHDS